MCTNYEKVICTAKQYPNASVLRDFRVCVQPRYALNDEFEEYPLDSIDRFWLQTHLNNLAEQMSQYRVKDARSYLKSILDEAIEQEFLTRGPGEISVLPTNGNY